MTADMIHVKTYDAPEYNIREILRYADCGKAEAEEFPLLKECLAELEGKLSYKVCWRYFPIRRLENGLDLSFAETDSAALGRNLADCDGVIVFAATTGLGIDRPIAKYGRISPSKSFLFHAVGAERIESLCDCFCAEIQKQAAEQERFIKPRFSPGYGDLPLEMQESIFRVLDCPRKIGLSLNKSLLMSPSKSVTALIGITEKNTGHSLGKCDSCENEGCAFRG